MSRSAIREIQVSSISVQRGEVLVIILCGGDKSTQVADIKHAKVIAKDLEF